jgi:hypothetical protein
MQKTASHPLQSSKKRWGGNKIVFDDILWGRQTVEVLNRFEDKWMLDEKSLSSYLKNIGEL